MHSATVSPVPACHAFFAVLAWPSVPARPPISPTLPRAVQAWTGGEEPYTTARTSCTGPSAIGLPFPVPTCPAALLPARSSFLPVPAWEHCKEPYSSPVPARHALFSLPARSCFLAVPAWAHGEEPYSYPVPARHALYSLPARSSILAVPAWAHGEEPYSSLLRARHALCSLSIPLIYK